MRRKLNAITITDAFPLPFTDSVLDAVASHDKYRFLDGFSGYNQIRMHPNDQEKTAFVTEWGIFVAVVMMFNIKTSPATFQRIILEIFGEYIPAFIQFCLHDFMVYGVCNADEYQRFVADHNSNCEKILHRLEGAQLTFSEKKSAFGQSDILVAGHLCRPYGRKPSPAKVDAILMMKEECTTRRRTGRSSEGTVDRKSHSTSM